MKLLAFLWRYGPRDVELMRLPKRFLYDVADAIGEIMKEEKAGWEQGLMTGDS